MRFTTTILLIILFIWGGISCRKEKTFRVRVYNPVTEEPYENVFVTIIERENKTSGYTTESSVFYEGFTDANGEVMITKKFHKNYDYLLQTGSPDGIDMCEIESKHEGRSSSVSLQLDNKDLDGSIAYVELIPCAQLKFKLKNISCQNGNDLLEVYFDGSEVGDEDYRIGKLFEQLGCIDIIDESWVNHTMGKRYYHWDVTKNGVTETFYDTIDLAAGEQRIFEINY